MKTKFALSVVALAMTSATAFATPTVGGAYDRIQDARTSVIEQDLNGVKKSVSSNSQRITAVEQVNAAQQTQIDGLSNDMQSQYQTNAAQDAAISSIDGKADAAQAAANAAQETANGKVSQADFNASQQAQDEHITAVESAAQTANDRSTALEGRADAVEAKNGQQDATLADHDSRITSNTEALKTKVEQADFAADQQRQDSAFKVEQTKRDGEFNTLTSGIKQAQDTGAYAQSRADAAYAHSEANRQALDATNKRVAQNTADIANHEQRIQTLESQTNSKFADLNKQIDDNRKRASAGIAGVAAMANIPQVLEHQTFAIGAGAGNTDGESALAVGFSARASQNTVVKASVSNDTQHNFVVGAGVAF
ncbi:YadA-like family protein, partial [Enterobacter sp. FL1277]